jgi:hypothetical protein
MKIQIGETVRDMTDNEIAEHNQAFADIATQAEVEAKAETQRAKARQAVLDRLGITADEAALLLG